MIYRPNDNGTESVMATRMTRDGLPMMSPISTTTTTPTKGSFLDGGARLSGPILLRIESLSKYRSDVPMRYIPTNVRGRRPNRITNRPKPPSIPFW